MTVPKASVDKNHGSVFRKHKIRPSRQIRAVNVKPKPQAMQRGSYRLFWLRILSLDARHHPAADFRCNGVSSHESDGDARFRKQELALAG